MAKVLEACKAEEAAGTSVVRQGHNIQQLVRSMHDAVAIY